MKKYNLIPRKVDIIKCVYTSSEENFGAMCKPENCRERKGTFLKIFNIEF